MSSLNESICSPSFILTSMPLIYETAPDVLRRLTDQRRRTDEWEVSRWSGKWVGRVWGHHTLSAHQVVWPCYTLLHLVIPCHTLSHSVMLWHILPHLVTPFHTLSHLVIPCYIFSHHFNLVIPCQSTCLTREQLIVPWWLSHYTNWQIKKNQCFTNSKATEDVIKLILMICLT